MSGPDLRVFVETESGREQQVTLTGSPEALRRLSEALARALGSLPSPLASGQDLRLEGVDAADGTGGGKETWLSVRAEPDGRWLEARRSKSARRDWAVILLLCGIGLLALARPVQRMLAKG